ncbi:sulfatase [Roseibacillus ishigakijimensis]|uniref:Sulfatase n=1 Tax=Roseibacillus ishigakijimensis TaxID=454146 RepID=A0A934RSI4_9BACT|nr:sulfatase [Roseibacillus ishigakijimensis]MBK1835122.1 sulfatase [Roseibacillus ishigakijimensis]
MKFVFVLLGLGLVTLSASPRPNLVFILADDLGWTDLRTGGKGPNVLAGVDYGSTSYQTPNLARLAEEGLSFTHCYVQPNCAPTRAAIFSGQYPARSGNGVYNVQSLNRGIGQPPLLGPEQNEDVPASHHTLAEALSEAGYVTAHFGKYHIGGHEGGAATLPEEQGFDFNFGGHQSGHPRSYTAGENGFHPTVGPGLNPFAQPYSESYVEQVLQGPQKNPLHRRALARPDLFPQARANDPGALVGKGKHLTDAMADAAASFLQSHGKSERAADPFYLQFHLYAVHTPIQPRRDLSQKYQSLPLTGAHQDASYAALVEGLDQTVGRLLDALEDPNGDGRKDDSLTKNTVVIFCSDNGGHVGPTANQPLRHRKGSHWEGGIRVPLIIRQPGTIPSGEQSDTLVHAVDFYPTLLELAGAKLKEDLTFDGISLARHLSGPAKTPRAREPIFYHFPGYLDHRSRPLNAVIKRTRGATYKLLYHYDLLYQGNPRSKVDREEGLPVLEQPWQLFNLDEDLSEKKDLLATADAPTAGNRAIARELAADLSAWLGQEGEDWNPKPVIERATGRPLPFPDQKTLRK